MAEWNWNPDSFSAIGTVGAFAATTWIILSDTFARRRKQAEEIVVWIDRMNSPPPDVRDVGLFLYIRNDSTAPVHKLHVKYAEVAMVGKIAKTGSCMQPVLGPHEMMKIGLAVNVVGTLEFTDSVGRRWERRIEGGRPRRRWPRMNRTGF